MWNNVIMDEVSNQEKLARYRHEAEVARLVKRERWRTRVARVLHALAERLEPSYRTGRKSGSLERVDGKASYRAS